MTARQKFVPEGVLIIAQGRESDLIRERIALIAERDVLKAELVAEQERVMLWERRCADARDQAAALARLVDLASQESDEWNDEADGTLAEYRAGGGK